MTRRLLALPLIVALAAACADTSSPLAPSPAALNTTPLSFSVSGNTTGPNGSIWMVTGSETLCATHYWYYYLTGSANVGQTTMDTVCRPSAMNTWNATTYNGGQISITGTYNGQVEALGAVSGDLSDEVRTVDLQPGTIITLEAYPQSGCEFSRWRIPGVTSNANPINVDPAQAASAQGWFHCSE